MGRQNKSTNATSQGKQHFSHPHILKPIVNPPETLTCNACEQPNNNKPNFHGCNSCQYFLHDNCFNAPRFLNHSSHPSHPLTLHQIPSYFESFLYLQGLWLCCPSSILVNNHPHQLELHFGSPYEDKNIKYNCDMCKVIMNKDDWLYYCAGCDFGSHLRCAITNPEVGVFPKQQCPNPNSNSNPNPSPSPSPSQNSNSNLNPNAAVEMINSVNAAHEQLIAAQIRAQFVARGQEAALDLI
ncbi:hypothetical protein H5410_012554 [Solanum commersonii]|uniref:DC1 domain-containing protein n=1 Tax=Solanum commersonii TaxID=4109 RepID=A0A9J6ARW0_SOLCO|nr:hypothetical protein H5410_012554 [Solanum commersonii]